MIAADGPTAELFTELTGIAHGTFTKRRARTGHPMTCTAFVGWNARTMGAREYPCRFAFRVGISLDFDTLMWNSVESGQGGARAGHDIIRRKRAPYQRAQSSGGSTSRATSTGRWRRGR